MEVGQPSVGFRSRFARLIAKFSDKAYRDSYVRSHTKLFLARQMRAFRGDKSQKEFAQLLGVQQSVVSERLENPNYGKWNLQTLFDIADKLNVAVFVRFVDHETFLKLTEDKAETAVHPRSYEKLNMSSENSDATMNDPTPQSGTALAPVKEIENAKISHDVVAA